MNNLITNAPSNILKIFKKTKNGYFGCGNVDNLPQNVYLDFKSRHYA